MVGFGHSSSLASVVILTAGREELTMWPNTALEPTAITPGSFRFGRRLADVFRRRGSALGR